MTRCRSLCPNYTMSKSYWFADCILVVLPNVTVNYFVPWPLVSGDLLFPLVFGFKVFVVNLLRLSTALLKWNCWTLAIFNTVSSIGQNFWEFSFSTLTWKSETLVQKIKLREFYYLSCHHTVDVMAIEYGNLLDHNLIVKITSQVNAIIT